jgi:hypothetical protein
MIIAMEYAAGGTLLELLDSKASIGTYSTVLSVVKKDFIA